MRGLAQGWVDQLLPLDPPPFSDRHGKVKADKADVVVPDGWEWRGDWYVDPGLPAVDIYGDQSHVIVEVYENERRQPILGFCAWTAGEAAPRCARPRSDLPPRTLVVRAADRPGGAQASDCCPRTRQRTRT